MSHLRKSTYQSDFSPFWKLTNETAVTNADIVKYSTMMNSTLGKPEMRHINDDQQAVAPNMNDFPLLKRTMEIEKSKEGEYVPYAHRNTKKFPVCEEQRERVYNPLYDTESSRIGRLPIKDCHKPVSYFPKSNKFSKGFICMNPANTQLRTDTIHSKVHRKFDENLSIV
eukprot:Platyproteum_vivax@DN1026_c0_g1_i1.p1